MKFPKNRGNLYLVERWTYDNSATVIVGGFSDYQSAADYRDACLQEWVDKVGEENTSKCEVVFNVIITTYYD